MPHAEVTVTAPLVAPAGTVAVTVLSFTTENVVAVVPLNLTAVAPVNPTPVIVTVLPIGPHNGVKLVTEDIV